MKTPFLAIGAAALTLAAIAAAQDHGIQSIIGNVFLQDTTPGTAQIGHANIKGTFRAGQVFASSPSAIIPIVGNNMSFTSGAIGGSFTSAAQNGIALRATATSTGSGGVGVSGESRSDGGIGVNGVATKGTAVAGTGRIGTYGTATNIGALGTTNGTFGSGAGVWGSSTAQSIPGLHAENTNAFGIAADLIGDVHVKGNGWLYLDYATGGAAVIASKYSTGSGLTVQQPVSGPRLSLIATAGGFTGLVVNDAQGFTRVTAEVNSQNQGVLTATVKNFVEPNPRDPREDIVYACVEGPEAAMYTRGTARLSNGRARVVLPSHFSALAAAEGVTVVLSPGSGASKGVAWEHKTTYGFDIVELGGGRGSYDVDWEVKAVRAGFEDYRVVRRWTERLDPRADKQQAYAARLREMRHVATH